MNSCGRSERGEKSISREEEESSVWLDDGADLLPTVQRSVCLFASSPSLPCGPSCRAIKINNSNKGSKLNSQVCLGRKFGQPKAGCVDRREFSGGQCLRNKQVGSRTRLGGHMITQTKTPKPPHCLRCARGRYSRHATLQPRQPASSEWQSERFACLRARKLQRLDKLKF